MPNTGPAKDSGKSRAHRGNENNRAEARACHSCGKIGHLARACGKGAAGARGGQNGGAARLEEAVRDLVAQTGGAKEAMRDMAKENRELREDLIAATEAKSEPPTPTEPIEAKDERRKAEASARLVHAKELCEQLDIVIGVRQFAWWTIILGLAVVMLGIYCASVGFYPVLEKVDQAPLSIVWFVNPKPSLVWWVVWRPLAAWLCPAVTHFCSLMSLALLLIALDKLGRWGWLATYSVRFVRWEDRESYPDFRADVHAMQGCKHENPLYCYVTLRNWLWSGETLISAELLAQLCSPKYMSHEQTRADARARIYRAVETGQFINLDRYVNLSGRNVALNTALVASAMWEFQADKAARMGFGLGPQ